MECGIEKEEKHKTNILNCKEKVGYTDTPSFPLEK
jgi:hypothetical protein